MTFQGESVKCSECGKIFTFTAGEQQFYLHRGLTRPPSRCAACRAARAPQQDGDGNYAYRAGSWR